MSDLKNPFVKAVTNEGTLFVYRVVTGLGAIYLIAKATAIDTNQEKMRNDISDLKFSFAQQLNENTAKVGILSARVDAQSRRLDAVDNSIRDVNTRMADWFFGKAPK
jgi:hypothetical protein